ncbi:zinc transporter ZIP9 isoform X1 [Cimex lectularius]|uniref:Zinc transporter ZIP9 n=1 Tax=Cimex lectularius TaxID=79782 RepID=A0A8I6RRQ1_CIMLE|nr:zinc transporter ZIP9 isoform X1 [Cimex lectularius]
MDCVDPPVSCHAGGQLLSRFYTTCHADVRGEAAVGIGVWRRVAGRYCAVCHNTGGHKGPLCFCQASHHFYAMLAEGDGTGLPMGHEGDLHSAIGLSLVLGFVIMLLIDQVFTSHTRDVEGGGGKPKLTATVGLLVHSAVDGVALGAAATTTHTEVELIVFVAIMLHKAPAAFGLVSFLMHEGLDRKRIKRHLLIFSLSAPIMSLFTYFCISQEGKEKLSMLNATGIAMLFSAGTFLYVATVHVLPELAARAGGSFRPRQLCALILGTLLPLVMSVGHHH